MLESIYDQGTRDRQYRFGCTRITSTSTCSWTDYLNNFDGPVNKYCDGYIGGIESIHSNLHEDRKWKIQCCNAGEGVTRGICEKNLLLNDFKEEIKLKLNPDKALVGLESYHDNLQE